MAQKKSCRTQAASSPTALRNATSATRSGRAGRRRFVFVESTEGGQRHPAGKRTAAAFP